MLVYNKAITNFYKNHIISSHGTGETNINSHKLQTPAKTKRTILENQKLQCCKKSTVALIWSIQSKFSTLIFLCCKSRGPTELELNIWCNQTTCYSSLIVFSNMIHYLQIRTDHTKYKHLQQVMDQRIPSLMKLSMWMTALTTSKNKHGFLSTTTTDSSHLSLATAGHFTAFHYLAFWCHNISTCYTSQS